MSKVLRISEAVSIALHAMGLLASEPERVFSNPEVVSALGVSGAHLSKVMQRLSKGGLVVSTRGPSGGFKLGRPAREIALIEIFEQIEGRLEPNDCLLPKRVCMGGNCILGGLIANVNSKVEGYLAGTKLSDVVDVYGKKNKSSKRGAADGADRPVHDVQ